MSFDLEISITGLCLFVPDGKRLHVLLMNHHHARHHARLIYDKVYEQNPTDQVLRCQPLDGFALILENLGNVIEQDVELPPEIVKLHEISGACKVPRRYLEGGPQPEVSARITLGSGGFAGIGPKARWKVTERPIAGKWTGEITTTVKWTISGIEGDQLRDQWRFLDLATGQDGFKLPLYPDADSGVIRIEIYNSLPEDLPPVTRTRWPEREDRAEHFESYFSVCGAPPVVPVLDEPPPAPNPDQRATECKPHTPDSAEQQDQTRQKGIVTAHTITCITAQASPE